VPDKAKCPTKWSIPTSVIKSWLGIEFEERELYNKNQNEANIERVKELLEDEE